MADAFYQLPSDTSNTGKYVDNSQVNDGTNNLLRQNIVVADPTTTNNRMTVKAASTAIQATDNPAAVGLHPSSPLPAGTNIIGAVIGGTVIATATTTASQTGDIIASTDISGYASVVLQVSGSPTGLSGTIQQCNDNSVFQAAPFDNVIAATVGQIPTTFNAASLYLAQRYGKYMKINFSANTSAGALTLTLIGFTNPVSPHFQTVFGVVQGNKTNNNAAPGATNVGNLGALANAAQPSFSEGNQTSNSVNLKGAQRTVLQDAALNDRGVNVTAANEALAVFVAATAYFANAVKTTVTVSGAAGRLLFLALMNTDAAVVYLQGFDTTGAVTLGSTAPTFVIPYPANSTAALGVADRIAFPGGINLVNGLKMAATTTPTGSTTSTNGLTGMVGYR